MRKTFTLLIALLALTVSTWATQITWNQADVQSVSISQYHGEYEPMSMTINGITVTATAPGGDDYSGFYYSTYDNDDHYSYISLDNGGTMTFATSLGVLSSIVIHLDAEKGSAYGFGEGWSENTTSHTLSWTGNAASAVLGNDGGQYGASIHHITSIDFTVVSVPTSTSWNLSDLASISISQYHGQGEPMSQTINGITATATALGSDDNSDFYYDSNANNGNIYLEADGTFTFSSPFGNLASIIIHTTNEYGIYTNGWSWGETEHTLSWTGNAASVVLAASVSDIISIDFAFVTEEPDPDVPTHLVSTVIWETADLATVNVPTNEFRTIKTIRVTNSCPDQYNDYCYFLYQDDPYNYCGFSMRDGGSLIFTPESGRLTSIVINWNYEGPDPDLVPGSGWSFSNSKLTWTSDDEDGAESVVLKSNSSDYLASGPIYSIVFTLAADPDAQADVKWDKSELEEIGLLAYPGTGSTNQTIDGIVATATAPEEGDYCHFLYDSQNDKVTMTVSGNGTLTFAPVTGRLTRIVIAGIVDSDKTNLPVESGWTPSANKLIWTGDASFSVDLANASIDHINYVAFTIDDSDPNDTREIPELSFRNGEYALTEATIVRDCHDDIFEPGTYYLPSTEYYLYVNNGVMYYQDQPFIDWATPTYKGLTMTYSVPNNDVITLTKTSGNSFEFTVNGIGDAVVTAHTDGNEDYKPASTTFTIHVEEGKAATKECVLKFIGGPNAGQFVPEDYKFEMVTGEEFPWSWFELREKDYPDYVYAPSFTIWGSRNYYVACLNADSKLRALTAGDDMFTIRYARCEGGDMNNEYRLIEFPVHIKPTEIALTTSVDFASDPSSNSAIANNATYDPTTQQVQIGQVISDEMVQAALTCYAFGHPGWDENLQNTISFELPQGTGSLKVNGTVQEGCVLKVKIRSENGVHSFTPAQVAAGEAVVEYDVPNQTAVVIYISTNGGSPAPKRAPAAKKDAPLAALSGIDMSPVYAITSKPDPDNSSVYYSTHFNETQKYRLPAGTDAYVATISGDDMNLTKVVGGGQVLPANTAVILRSTSASVTLTPTDAAAVEVSAANQLRGTDSEMAAPANCYVLSGHSTDNSVTGVGFYQFTGTLAAHKAYLTIGGAAPAPKRLRFVFNGENAATGIENTSASFGGSEKRLENGQLIIIKNGVRYNAQGQIVK